MLQFPYALVTYTHTEAADASVKISVKSAQNCVDNDALVTYTHTEAADASVKKIFVIRDNRTFCAFSPVAGCHDSDLPHAYRNIRKNA